MPPDTYEDTHSVTDTITVETKTEANNVVEPVVANISGNASLNLEKVFNTVTVDAKDIELIKKPETKKNTKTKAKTNANTMPVASKTSTPKVSRKPRTNTKPN